MFGMLDMSSEDLAYAHLVGVNAMGTSCDSSVTQGVVWTRVVPGHADSSLMFLKVKSKLTGALAPCGDPMPGDATTLSADEVALIRAWIDGGAPR
jgi:hypothetical protein